MTRDSSHAAYQLTTPCSGPDPQQLDEITIQLPHADRPGGHAATGLNRRCVAVCSWVMVLHGNRIVTKRGDCPPGLPKRITRTVERIADEGIADDSND